MSTQDLYDLWVSSQFECLHTHIDNSRVFLAIKQARALVTELKKWIKQDPEALVAVRPAENPEQTATPEPESKEIKDNERNAEADKVKVKVELVPPTETNKLSAEQKQNLSERAQVWLQTWAEDPRRTTLMTERELCLRLMREFEIQPSDDGVDGLLEGEELEAVLAKERANDPHIDEPGRGWKLSDQDSHSTTHYRKEPGSDLYSFRVSGIANVSIHDIFPVIYEASLYYHWFPLMKASEELAMVTRFHKIVRTTVSCPWPLANRMFDLEARGVDNTEEGRILINIESIKSSRFVELPEVPKGDVVADMEHAGYLIEILSPTQTRLSFYANVDIKMGFLPTWLLNIATKTLVQMIVRSIEDAAKSVNDPAKPWVQRMQMHEAVYRELRAILDGYLVSLKPRDEEPSQGSSAK